MLFKSIRDFRTNIHAVANEDESVVVTKHGKPVFIAIPWGFGSDVSLAEKRKEWKALKKEREQYFGHINEKEMLTHFEKWRKDKRSSR